jgi:uncharacterized protein (DUF924 family)
MPSETRPHRDRADRSAPILSYWFADLDDRSTLDAATEPFRTCLARWYGKHAAIDREIRERFEPDLQEILGPRAALDREREAWAREPQGLLALVILLDQLPRNMYRGTPGMYANDALALATAREAIARGAGESLPLVRRMFLFVPLMHAEDLATQREMVAHFEGLAAEAARRSPQSLGFFEGALRSARSHAEVIERFGRFPHRNAILSRASTPDEEEYLRGPDAGF